MSGGVGLALGSILTSSDAMELIIWLTVLGVAFAFPYAHFRGKRLRKEAIKEAIEDEERSKREAIEAIEKIERRKAALSEAKGRLEDRSQLHLEANEALDENLMTAERVRVIITGTHDSALIGTDRRVFVFKKGFTGGVFGGKKLASWDYRNVAGVQLETGSFTGVVSLQVIGAAAADLSYWATGAGDPQRSPNALAITLGDFDQAGVGVAVLRQLIATAQSPTQTSANTLQFELDLPERLRELARLRDAGIISQTEFDSKKTELLARI